MTFILGIIGKKRIAMMADRRLTFANGQYRDDGVKLFRIHAGSDRAIMGYAGIGVSQSGREVSDWMRRVIKGKKGDLESYLKYIFNKIDTLMPETMSLVQANSHSTIAVAQIQQTKRIYTHGVCQVNNRRNHSEFKLWRNRNPNMCGVISPRICITGSGALHARKKNQWERDLITTFRRFEDGLISLNYLTKHLHSINVNVAAHDKFVSRKCIIVLTDPLGGSHFSSMGEKDGIEDRCGVEIPTIDNGVDISELIQPFLAQLSNVRSPAEFRQQCNNLNINAMNTALANLPKKERDNL